MKFNYKQKIFFSFCLLITLFAGSIIFFEKSEAKRYKTEALEERLNVYSSLIYRSLQKKDTFDIETINSIISSFPRNLRVTILSHIGDVLFDNTISKDDLKLENHSKRPEIIQAQKKGSGSDIRISTTTSEKYLYYAKQYQTLYIRVALPYNIETKEILKADNIFLYFIIILFLIAILLVYRLSNRLSQSIRQLRDFTVNQQSSTRAIKTNFPDDELGEVASQMVDNYKELKHSQSQIALEREKLLQHIHTSEEGICFFTASKKVEFYNGLFMHYLNIMLDKKSTNPAVILTDPLYSNLQEFIQAPENNGYYETKIERQGKQFNIRISIFDDNSFEIIINDITKREKTRLLKQEMTSNIAHELRTPITSIRGYLETIKSQNLSTEQNQYFIDKAYNQVINLSQLIDDMSMITKIEEVPQSFDFEKVSISEVIEEVYTDFKEALQQENIELYNSVPENCLLKGNRNLLYAVFRNLVENTIKYGGNKAHIYISCYNEDEYFYYFSYADEGKGISGDEHLNRLFERFYRISAGRTRKTGGTGLGLSIVKNAIQIHKGTIIAKNRIEGGLEFLFKIKK
ncbi:integral membrane sensor signal transduction histidine kinase [Bacteroides coprosuis DSM 18011]|uniref:histidine kinase n=1 Tax=Bacteroides coprosuis DSM 18011 TaxID=679937 RepID=F3ZV23_9BACE|nr:ATP-binding protein [Bacteroides coprosuis]EGJ72481.1 integral membrane sensor signal transduction histidine kinase [Bacteroides coprosuis DSM 18011]